MPAIVRRAGKDLVKFGLAGATTPLGDPPHFLLSLSKGQMERCSGAAADGGVSRTGGDARVGNWHAVPEFLRISGSGNSHFANGLNVKTLSNANSAF